MAKQTFTTGQVLTAAQMQSLQQTALGGGATTAKTVSYVLVAADAGTVVQMNSASATTITVNTALFAAGDTVQIQNVGAGVCTVTAGTATVSTSATLALKQYDAGTLYFNTTSAAFFFAVDAADGMTNVLTTTGDIIYSSSGTTAARLGIGTTGQSLVVAAGIPSWATASAGALTKIVSTSFTASSAVNTNNCFSATYLNYRIILRFTGSVSAGCSMKFRVGGVDNSGSNYSYSGWATNTGGASSVNTGALTTSYDIIATNTGGFSTVVMDIINPFPAAATAVTWNANSGDYTNNKNETGAHTASTSFDGFSLIPSGTMTGTLVVYGYAD